MGNALLLKTKGTVSTYRSRFRHYSLIGNQMIGVSASGRPLIVRLRTEDYDQ